MPWLQAEAADGKGSRMSMSFSMFSRDSLLGLDLDEVLEGGFDAPVERASLEVDLPPLRRAPLRKQRSTRERTGPGRDLNGAYRTDPEQRLVVSLARKTLRDANRCINGSMRDGPSRFGITHGPVVPGTGKCERCCEVARASR